MPKAISFFNSRQRELMLASSLYVIFLILSHWQLPEIHVWIIAAFFSIIMNFTYITEAYCLKKYVTMEASVASLLIVLSILGVFIWPVFVIAAIFGHGCWDIAKHRGAGVPFMRWYTLGCFAVDMLYSTVLMLFWLTSFTNL